MLSGQASAPSGEGRQCDEHANSARRVRRVRERALVIGTRYSAGRTFSLLTFSFPKPITQG